MKRISILLLTALIIALSGCQSGAQIKTFANTVTENPQTTKTASQETPTDTKAMLGAPFKKSNVNLEDVVEIKEKMFIAQTNDIYINKEDYIGRTIRYEGIFEESTWEETGETYRFVIRFGPGCCPGVDDSAGFEVIWNNGYPEPNDWVEAVGVLEEYDEYGETYLRLALYSLTVLDVRGEEYVNQ
jgi:uncharacterized membrane protein YcgQ (UPF0703/DUF1980 family)